MGYLSTEATVPFAVQRSFRFMTCLWVLDSISWASGILFRRSFPGPTSEVFFFGLSYNVLRASSLAFRSLANVTWVLYLTRHGSSVSLSDMWPSSFSASFVEEAIFSQIWGALYLFRNSQLQCHKFNSGSYKSRLALCHNHTGFATVVYSAIWRQTWCYLQCGSTATGSGSPGLLGSPIPSYDSQF